ncbi:hypothetical protein TrCOL_g2922 [Triparma columacea]|uniref:RRM domain-containing protein n=1 Tax=Triparma columacea TaxID=722753 RepID=A0A9W7GCT6_9STRA|nr:hypothetical protein TrCOL_g2922 [Triparma columacea]
MGAKAVPLTLISAAFPSFLPTLTKFIVDAVGFEDDVLIDIIQTSITEGNSDVLSKADRHFDLPTMIKQVEGFLGAKTSSLSSLIKKFLQDVESNASSSNSSALLTNGGGSNSSNSNKNDYITTSNSPPPPSDRSTLHVGNIPYTWNVPTLLSSLSTLTSCSIISVNIPPSSREGMEGENRGFAFVEVKKGDAIRFRGDVAGEEVEGGRKLRVSEAAPRQNIQGRKPERMGYGGGSFEDDERRKREFNSRMTGEGVRNRGGEIREGRRVINNTPAWMKEEIKEERKNFKETKPKWEPPKNREETPFVPPGKRGGGEDDGGGESRPKKKSRWGSAKDANYSDNPVKDREHVRTNNYMAKGPDGTEGFKEGWRGEKG